MACTRRAFIRNSSMAAIALRSARARAAFAQTPAVAPSDTVRFALIGSGVRGCQHLETSLLLPGVQCIAVSDLYDDRLIAAREYLKQDVPTFRDYRSILDRKDIDAVLIAATDHQHSRLVQDACAAGKDVYCEKPLSHNVAEGFAMVAAADKHQRMVQAGAQRVSSVLFARAREIYQSGKLGQVVAIEAYTDRNSAGGAWEYPIPPGVSMANIDWKAWLGDAPSRPFDANRFFRWRCFTDYGSGLAGDLFVHLISGIQFITGVNQPPLRAQTTGGIFRWKDGREFPDLMETLYDYPGFRVSIRCNQNNAAGENTIFYGTLGTLTVGGSNLSFQPQNIAEQPDTYGTIGWSAKLRADYLADWAKAHPTRPPLEASMQQTADSFSTPPHYDDTRDHQAAFFQSVRTRQKPVEDVVFGNNAAISCHMANHSYFKNTPAVWDPQAHRIRS